MKYPIGIQTFEKIREGGYVYVDKTAFVYQLAQDGCFYFLSRPRRFGKSLLISTLDAYFHGRKDLFEGLAIEQLEKDWTVSPVLRMDFNGGLYNSVDGFRRVLSLQLSKWEDLYGSNPAEQDAPSRFGGIIERACKQTEQKVAILVDEYDKPLLESMDNETVQEEIRTEMKAFFSQVKKQDQYIRFGFFTGVTKFSKVSIFSDLNNLTDLTLDARYECICGISKTELTDYFKESIAEMAETRGTDYDTMLAKLTKKYDGYHFSKRMTDIFNPFSVLTAMWKQDLGCYWYESGTPTFLMKLLRRNAIAINTFEGMKITDRLLGSIDAMKSNPAPVFYQSGYLTIKGYDDEDGIYTLGFPNEEVTDGFFNFLLPYYTNVRLDMMDSDVWELRNSIKVGDVDRFMAIMQSFFAGYDYSVIGKESLEVHYQNVVFIVCKLIGLRVKAEYHTSNGRIDMLIETNDRVYIFEYKLNVSAGKAMRQIEAKDYAAKFATDPRKLYKIGVNFDSEIRGIKDWEIVER